MNFAKFDIVIVPFPFTDSKKKKYRPALVVSNKAYIKETNQCVLLMITSAKNSKFFRDIKITQYNGTGLKDTCLIRMKFFTLSNDVIETKIGRLDSKESKEVQSALQEILY
jgi:mRNA interferase MazF